MEWMGRTPSNDARRGLGGWRLTEVSNAGGFSVPRSRGPFGNQESPCDPLVVAMACVPLARYPRLPPAQKYTNLCPNDHIYSGTSSTCILDCRSLRLEHTLLTFGGDTLRDPSESAM